MTPTETSATREKKPGRKLDIAVAYALGWTQCFSLDDTKFWREADERTLHGVLPAFSTDDATALRWCVPWLNKNGWWPGFTQVRPEEDEEGTPGDWFVEVTRAEDHDDRRYMAEAKSIAAALAQVIVAVSEVK